MQAIILVKYAKFIQSSSSFSASMYRGTDINYLTPAYKRT